MCADIEIAVGTPSSRRLREVRDGTFCNLRHWKLLANCEQAAAISGKKLRAKSFHAQAALARLERDQSNGKASN
jgi:hypothetical protein